MERQKPRKKIDIAFACMNRMTVECMAARVPPTRAFDLILWTKREYLSILTTEGSSDENPHWNFKPCTKREAIKAGYVGYIWLADGRKVAVVVDAVGTGPEHEADALIGPAKVQLFDKKSPPTPTLKLLDRGPGKVVRGYDAGREDMRSFQ